MKNRMGDLTKMIMEEIMCFCAFSSMTQNEWEDLEYNINKFIKNQYEKL